MLNVKRLSKNNWKCLYLFYTSNFNRPLFHTARIPVLGRGETDLDYLECLRPATIKVSDVPTLAGDPRTPIQYDYTIEPEVFQKWNHNPKRDIYWEWAKLSGCNNTQ